MELTKTDSPTIQPPPDKQPHFEDKKSDFIRMIGSIAGLPAIVTDDWIRAVVLEIQKPEGIFQRLGQLRSFYHQFGKHYQNATFASFRVNNLAQKKVLAQVQGISEKLDQSEQLKQNLLFFGPSGTGKDHLLYCLLMKAIFLHGYQVCWHDGNDLFGKFRNAVGLGTIDSLVKELQQAEIFAVSDPLPLAEDLSPFLMNQWYCVVEYRYRHNLPIWLTVNVKDREDFKQRFSIPTAGRLRQLATTIHFNWENYREQ